MQVLCMCQYSRATYCSLHYLGRIRSSLFMLNFFEFWAIHAVHYLETLATLCWGYADVFPEEWASIGHSSQLPRYGLGDLANPQVDQLSQGKDHHHAMMQLLSSRSNEIRGWG